jgi:hypothetical protein
MCTHVYSLFNFREDPELLVRQALEALEVFLVHLANQDNQVLTEI